jgi:hypothetical protein
MLFGAPISASRRARSQPGGGSRRSAPNLVVPFRPGGIALDEHGRVAPTDAGEGCNVNLSWLVGREIVSATSDLQSLTLTFRDGTMLVVRAGLFRGAPLLSFDPWRPACSHSG